MGDIENELRKTQLLWEQLPNLAKELELSNSISAAIAANSRLTQDLGLTQSIAKMFADQEAIARQYALNPAFKDMPSWKESSAMSSVLETLRGHDLLPRAVIGPLADLKRLGLLNAQADTLRDFGLDRNVLAGFEARFRLPDAMEAARLADVFDTSLAAKALESFTGGLSVRAAMESVKSPWLDAANPSVSASAFAVIQQMGSAIGNTWRTSWARCRPTRIPAFIIFMATARSTKLPAE